MMLNVISKRAGAWAGFAMGLVGALPAAGADPAPTIAAPVVHENMAVYVIRGPSTPGPVPLTLQEALAAKTVAVHETGRVQQLELENSGDQPVFVQLGDIVKGAARTGC